MPPDARYSALLDGSTRCWNYALVHGVFIPSEAAEILRIPIFSQQLVDQLIWGPTKNGLFTVKTTHYIVINLVSESAWGGTSYSYINSSFRKTIWNVTISNKVKNLAWRACGNSLPSKQNLLLTRKVMTSATCVFGDDGFKDTFHTLCTCPVLVPVWKAFFDSNRFDLKDISGLIIWFGILFNMQIVKLFPSFSRCMGKHQNLNIFYTAGNIHDVISSYIHYMDNFQQLKVFQQIRK